MIGGGHESEEFTLRTDKGAEMKVGSLSNLQRDFEHVAKPEKQKKDESEDRIGGGLSSRIPTKGDRIRW